MSDLPSYDKVTVERVLLTCRKVLDEYNLGGDVSIETCENACGEALVMQLVAHFAGIPKDRLKVYAQWPDGWWQAVRERWWPAWVLRRWPVKYKTIDIDRTVTWHVCPHVNVSGKRPHLLWLREQSEKAVGRISP